MCSNVPTLKCTVNEYVGDHHFLDVDSHFVFSLLSALLKVNLSAHLDDAHDVGSEDLAEEQNTQASTDADRNCRLAVSSKQCEQNRAGREEVSDESVGCHLESSKVIQSLAVKILSSLSWRVRAAPPSVDCREAIRARPAPPGTPINGRRIGVSIWRAAFRAP